MPGFVTRRPNDHHHSISKKSDGLIARLAIVPPRVLHRNRRTGKNHRCIDKIQTPLAESSLTLRLAWRQLTPLIYHVFKLMLETGIYTV